jgi:hypothetical protein
MIGYRQSDGDITLDGQSIGAGYSGHGIGFNNPAEEAVHGVGPIPRGQWQIAAWYDNYGPKGPTVARLSPVGHDAHGRSGFLIHGDNSAMDHTASDGCIIASRDIRSRLRASGETLLEVV